MSSPFNFGDGVALRTLPHPHSHLRYEFPEPFRSQRLRQAVRNRILHWTIFPLCRSIFNAVSDGVILDVNVLPLRIMKIDNYPSIFIHQRLYILNIAMQVRKMKD